MIWNDIVTEVEALASVWRSAVPLAILTAAGAFKVGRSFHDREVKALERQVSLLEVELRQAKDGQKATTSAPANPTSILPVAAKGPINYDLNLKVFHDIRETLLRIVEAAEDDKPTVEVVRDLNERVAVLRESGHSIWTNNLGARQARRDFLRAWQTLQENWTNSRAERSLGIASQGSFYRLDRPWDEQLLEFKEVAAHLESFLTTRPTLVSTFGK